MDVYPSRALVSDLPKLSLDLLYVLAAHPYLLLRRVPVCGSLILRESVVGFCQNHMFSALFFVFFSSLRDAP